MTVERKSSEADPPAVAAGHARVRAHDTRGSSASTSLASKYAGLRRHRVRGPAGHAQAQHLVEAQAARQGHGHAARAGSRRSRPGSPTWSRRTPARARPVRRPPPPRPPSPSESTTIARPRAQGARAPPAGGGRPLDDGAGERLRLVAVRLDQERPRRRRRRAAAPPLASTSRRTAAPAQVGGEVARRRRRRSPAARCPRARRRRSARARARNRAAQRLRAWRSSGLGPGLQDLGHALPAPVVDGQAGAQRARARHPVEVARRARRARPRTSRRCAASTRPTRLTGSPSAADAPARRARPCRRRTRARRGTRFTAPGRELVRLHAPCRSRC